MDGENIYLNYKNFYTNLKILPYHINYQLYINSLWTLKVLLLGFIIFVFSFFFNLGGRKI